MKVPFSFLTEQFADPEPIFDRIRSFLRRCDFTLGEDVEEFERKYAAFTGSKYAIGVGTGTDALVLSLKGLGVKPGDEVVTSANTFIATAGAIVQVGAKPVFVDCGDDLNIDPNQVEGAITSKTAALLPVHWAGGPADMESILEIARVHRVPVVEDACQALGAKVGARSAGTLGNAGAFSVHPIKPLHVWGDGGVIVTDDEELCRKLQLIRNHGMASRDEIEVFGVNSRLDSLQAIVGNFVFESLPQTLGKRIGYAERFDSAFREERFAGKIEIPKRPTGTHVYHLYQVFSRERDRLVAFLKSKGIEAKVHYPIPLPLQPAAKHLGYKKGDFPRAERICSDSVTLPCHQFLTDAQIDYAIEAVAEFHGV